MRNIDESREFKKDKKRIERSGSYRKNMKQRLTTALITLANDGVLDYSYRDHELIGDKKGYRECHILFDLVLLYRYEGDDLLILERLGSHSDILEKAREKPQML